MNDVYVWVLAHSAELATGLGLVMGLASLITGLTPTPKDDAVVAKVRDFLHRVGVLRYSDEPGSVKLPGQGPRK